MSSIRREAYQLMNYLCQKAENGSGIFSAQIVDAEAMSGTGLTYAGYSLAMQYLKDKGYIDGSDTSFMPLLKEEDKLRTRMIRIRSLGVDFAEGVI